MNDTLVIYNLDFDPEREEEAAAQTSTGCFRTISSCRVIVVGCLLSFNIDTCLRCHALVLKLVLYLMFEAHF